MVILSVCLEIIYDDDSFEERIRRAATVAEGVEFWSWRDKDLERLQATTQLGVPVVGCVADGVLTDPEVAEETVVTVRESIQTAVDLNCPSLIVTTGPEQNELSRQTQHQNVVNVLSRLAPDAEAAGVTLVLEPLNTAVDHPENYLTTATEGFEIIEAIDSPAVKLLYDVYHQQITEGNIIETIDDNIMSIGHIHIADVPGRHEPGTGELNYHNILKSIDETEYSGFVGCEFSPLADPDVAVTSLRDSA